MQCLMPPPSLPLPLIPPQVWEAADVLIKAALPLTTSDTKTVSEWISQMATLPQASNLATRILLLTLLFEVSPLDPMAGKNPDV